MRRLAFVLSCAVLVFSCLLAVAQEQAAIQTLLVKTDLDCIWKLDGQPMGLLKADASKVVPVSPGEHLIQAATIDELVKVRTKVEADQGQKMVELQLKSQHDQKLKLQQAEAARKQAEAEAALHPTWTDPDTGLMWAKKDNGSDVDWNQASDYCSKLQLADYKDWRLATIEELKGIYDTDVRVPTVWDAGITTAEIKGKLQLTGWQWSSSVEDKPVKVAWSFDFIGEPQDGFPLIFSYNMRALCVRRPAE
jgi:hypothetical protein